MKTILAVAVLAAGSLLANVNTSAAADHGQVPSGVLSQMGLSSMQPMSDAEGLAVRGKGVTVQTNTVVIVNIAGAQNNNLSTASFIQVNVKKLNLNLSFCARPS